MLMYIYDVMAPGTYATGSSQAVIVYYALATGQRTFKKMYPASSESSYNEYGRCATTSPACAVLVTRVTAKNSSAPHPAIKSYQDGYLWGRGHLTDLRGNPAQHVAQPHACAEV